jgi:hypothetical protein
MSLPVEGAEKRAFKFLLYNEFQGLLSTTAERFGRAAAALIEGSGFGVQKIQSPPAGP